METGILPHFLHHPWPSAFSPGLLLPLPSNHPRFCAKFSIGTRNHSTGITRSRNFSESIDGEWRRSTKKRRRRFNDGPFELEEMAPRFLEEFVDNMWFLKVLGSYGYMLPLIIPSWLLASRPKPFFTALSVPLGLSVLTYVFKKLLGWTQSSRMYNPETYNGINMKEDEQKLQIQEKSILRVWHQSHVQESRENGSVNRNGALSFGGWEDLVDEWELAKRRAKRFSRATAHTETLLEKRTKELTQRAEGERDLSPVLRLLVAVLPHP